MTEPCTAVIVTYQSAGRIGALLEALQAERDAGLDLEVVVVDNASTDGTAEIVTTFGWVTLRLSGGNLGYAAGVNIGNRMVPRERALLILNPDLVTAPGAVTRLLDGLGGPPSAGVVVPRVVDETGALDPSLRNEPSIAREFVDAIAGARAAWLPPRWSGVVWDRKAYTRERFPDWAVGAALLVSADCRAAAGDWDERYFLYSEEVDYLRRVREAGFLIRYEPAAVVRHVSGGSGRSDRLHALLIVNTVRYYRRYHRRFPAAVFAGAAALGQLLRIRRPASRLALRALLSPEVRSTLPKPAPVSDHERGTP